MTITKPEQLIKGHVYVVRSTVSGQVGATYLGTFGFEVAFRTAGGEFWTVPKAYFVSAEEER